MNTRRSFIGQIIGFIGTSPIIGEKPPVKYNYDPRITQAERIINTLKLPDEELLKCKIVLMSFEEEFAVIKVARIEREEASVLLILPEIYITQTIEINGCKVIDPNNWFIDHRINSNRIYVVPGDKLNFKVELKLEVR